MGEGKSQEIYNRNNDQQTAWTEGLVRALNEGFEGFASDMSTPTITATIQNEI